LREVRKSGARWRLEESPPLRREVEPTAACGGGAVSIPAAGQVLHVADGGISSLRLRHRIASGGMGDVWVADCLGDGEEVAVKFGTSDSDGEGAISRALHEANVLHCVRHPNVVQLLATGRLSNRSPFIVMELLQGRTLAAELALGGPLSLEAAARAMGHIACALEHIHGLEIVHRDIKPQNLFVCGDGNAAQVKIIDFGLATTGEGPRRRHARSRIAGSLAFMSPEDLLATQCPSVQSDLWALAVTAYLMLTRRLPFGGRSSRVWRHCPNAWSFDQPSVHRADIPVRVDEWFQRAFSRHRSERFASAALASAEFRRAIAEHEATAFNRRQCLSDDEILAFSTGSMSPVAVQLADDHCGVCQACGDLLNAIAGFAAESALLTQPEPDMFEDRAAEALRGPAVTVSRTPRS